MTPTINRSSLIKKWAIVIVGLAVVTVFFQEMLYYYFLHMLVLSFFCFGEGLVTLGLITFFLQFIAWFIFGFFFFYLIIFNMVFPRIRLVNGMRSKNTIARKCLQMISDDENWIFLKVKFRILPIFDWYTLKLPNPKYQKQYSFKRMPSSIDVHSESIDCAWDSIDELYFITENPMRRCLDAPVPYKDDIRHTIKEIGESVGESIQGDADMIKDYYTLNLVMDEKKEYVPAHKLRAPPSKQEKKIDEASLDDLEDLELDDE